MQLQGPAPHLVSSQTTQLKTANAIVPLGQIHILRDLAFLLLPLSAGKLNKM